MNEQPVSQDFNGWSNRETWLADLWLCNDEFYYALPVAALRIEGDTYDKTEWLESELRELLFEAVIDASLWQDLLACAFSRIDWVEVIEKNLE